MIGETSGDVAVIWFEMSSRYDWMAGHRHCGLITAALVDRCARRWWGRRSWRLDHSLSERTNRRHRRRCLAATGCVTKRGLVALVQRDEWGVTWPGRWSLT